MREMVAPQSDRGVELQEYGFNMADLDEIKGSLHSLNTGG